MSEALGSMHLLDGRRAGPDRPGPQGHEGKI